MIDSLNWEAITDAVEAECVDPMMIPQAVEAIDRSLRRWLPTDLREIITLGGIEQVVLTQRNGRQYKGVIDLWGWDADGNVKIMDWKTAKTLDQRWQDRQERSEQGAWYGLLLMATDVNVMDTSVEFRGVQNPDAKILKSARQTLALTDLQDLDEDLSRWEQWYGILDKDWNRSWPKDRTGCLKYGPQYPCAFLAVCNGDKEYNYTGEPPEKGMSFSMLGELQRCPERLRLLTLTALDDESPAERSESSMFGKAFHAGIAVAYEEAFKRRDQ